MITLYSKLPNGAFFRKLSPDASQIEPPIYRKALTAEPSKVLGINGLPAGTNLVLGYESHSCPPLVRPMGNLKFDIAVQELDDQELATYLFHKQKVEEWAFSNQQEPVYDTEVLFQDLVPWQQAFILPEAQQRIVLLKGTSYCLSTDCIELVFRHLDPTAKVLAQRIEKNSWALGENS